MMGFGPKRTKHAGYEYTFTPDPPVPQVSFRYLVRLWFMQRSNMEKKETSTGSLVRADVNDVVPNTFVAFDLHDGRQIVGVFERWHTIELRPDEFEAGFTISEAWAHKPVTLPKRLIMQAWWAPMGYRAEAEWQHR